MSDQANKHNQIGGVTEAYGKIIVIKRTGQDSANFELIDEGYTFGR